MGDAKSGPVMNTNRGVLGVNLGHMWDRREMLVGWLDQILTWHGEGKVRPHVDRAFSFADAPAAHAYIQDRKTSGRSSSSPECDRRRRRVIDMTTRAALDDAAIADENRRGTSSAVGVRTLSDQWSTHPRQGGFQ
jgi:hypothetical protein